jgi:CheY-like chemotaxis protein
MSMPQSSDQATIDSAVMSTLNREHRHALKNIFSIIIANAEMIAEDHDRGGQFRRRLERILEASRRGESLIEQIQGGNVSITSETADTDRSDPVGDGRLRGRVMVVDDEPDVVEIICRYLSKEGLEIVGQTDSVEALHQLLGDPRPFDLVITDLDMPRCTGADLCSNLHRWYPDLPVILITGYGRSVTPEEIAYAGIREMLSKPINRRLLVSTLRRLLSA